MILLRRSSEAYLCPHHRGPLKRGLLQCRRRAAAVEETSSWAVLGERAVAKIEKEIEAGARLLVCPTPLGEISDATFRSVAALKRADVIACEDTRKTGSLLKELGIPRTQELWRHDSKTAGTTAVRLAEAMVREDKVVAVVSDAGTPGISDPGAYLVKIAADVGIKVIALPGACAATTALSLSGVDAGKGFLFFGFPRGRNLSQRRKQIALILDEAEQRPVVFFESPKRVRETVDLLCQMLPGLHLVVARELTKTHENVFRGYADACLAWIDSGCGGQISEPRGEFTVIVDHKAQRGSRTAALVDDVDFEDNPPPLRNNEDALEVARDLLAAKRKAGLSLAVAAKQVARSLDLTKSVVYKLAIHDEHQHDGIVSAEKTPVK